MRQFARLLIEVDKQNCIQGNEPVTHIDLEQCISGSYFDLVLDTIPGSSVIALTIQETGHTFQIQASAAHAASKMVHSLFKCAKLKGLAIGCGSETK